MTLLTAVQAAASQIGLRQPQALFGSTDQTAQTLLRFAQQEGDELSRWHDWQALIVEKTFTTLAQYEQTNALPAADYDRLVYTPEIWNRSANLRYAGPTSARKWEQLKAVLGTGIIGWWRIIGGELHIFPAPTAGQTLGFEYVSKCWCTSASGTAQSALAADTDLFLIPERLVILGMVWRFRQSKGFAQYAEDLSTYEREKERAAARDRGAGRYRPDSSDVGDWDKAMIWPFGTIGGS